jgi:WD40 repeat protein
MARAAFLFLLFALPVPAAEPPKLPPVEQLPDGALVRLGSPYFRHGGLSDFVWLDGGKSIATVGDGVVRVWDAATGKRTKALILKGAAGGRAFAFSADGKRVAVGSGTMTSVHDTATGEVLATRKGQQNPTAQLAFAPDGRRLFVGEGGGQMAVWDPQVGTEKAVPLSSRWGTDSTYHGHFSPDGKRFVAGVQANQPLTVFDTATWEKVHEFDRHAATSTFTPDGKRLLVSSLQNDGNREAVILVFDADTGKELRRYPMGHNKIYFSLAVSPDGKTLACGASDRSCLVDLETGKVLHRLTGRPWGLAFSPDGKTFAASASGTHLRLREVATGKERFDEIGNFGSDLATAVSPDGRLLAAAEWLDREVHLWDTSTGKPVRRFPLRGSERYTRDVSFSPDGRAVTAGMYEGFAQVCEVATGKVLRYVELDRAALGNVGTTSFVSVRVLPDRQRVATVERVYEGNQSTRVAVWDAATGRPTWVLSLPGLSNSRAWSADGETLAIDLDAGVVLIDLDTGNERAKLEGSAPINVVVTMSADGRLVACVRGDPKKEPQTVGVYEVATGRLVANIAARGDLAIARDNRTLFTADAKFIRAWDLATGKETAKRIIPETWMDRFGRATVTQIVPLAGRRVFTPLTDGTGLVWDFAPAPTTGGKPDEKQLAACWADLRDEPAKAYAAVWRMADASPEVVVPFLGRHLRPEAAPDPARLRQLIADLNSDTFRVREKAAKELEDLGHAAAPALRKALAERPPAETVQQIERLLARKPDVASRPDQLRRLRAMQVLERLGTADARQILSDLAAGLPLAAETKEAQAALARTSP